MTLQKGSLVIFKKKPAVVTACSDKIDIEIAGGGSKSVRDKDVMLLHDGPAKLSDLNPLENPELDDTLEMLSEESVSFEEFAELLYGEFTPVSAWSAWLLLEEGRYFTGDFESVSARSKEDIEAEQQAELEKEQVKLQRAEFIERVRTGNLQSDDFVHMRDVENLALGKTAGSGVMKDLSMEQTPEKAHQLLLKTGVWDCWIDPWPSRAGVPLDDPEFQVPELPEESREDLTAMEAFAIDDEGNQDPDDAISYDGELLWVHIADVAALVTPGSDIDKEAEARGANLYVPEKIVHMLPPGMTGVLGLGLTAESVALSFGLSIGADGTPDLKKIVPSRIKVTRLSYEQAEPMLDSGKLKEIYDVVSRFHNKRIASGAVNIGLPEVKIKVEGESSDDKQVMIKPLPSLKSREMVTDAMTAAGMAIALYCDTHGIPIPYAVQPEPDVEITVPDNYAAMLATRKSFSPTTMQLVPGRHFGLGLDAYTRATSPLRRYSDLLVHQQIRAHISGGELLSSDEISGKIAVAERAAMDLRKTERIANEYWKLVYLQNNPDWTGKAVAVDKMDDRVTLLVPALAYEFKSRLGSKTELNSEFDISINSIQLPGLTARFNIH